MRKVTVRRIIQSLFVLFLFLYPIPHTLYPTYAACVEPGVGVKIKDCFGFGEFTSLGEATSKLVMPIFSVVAAIVVIYFLWGAFKYIISRGDKEAVAEARGTIIHAIIGFVLLMFAFLILQFLLSSLFGITGFQIIGT